MERTFSLIAAIDLNRGIGKNGKLPWHLPGDMRHFKKTTTEATPGLINAVVMGSNTWLSLPEKNRPLEGRLNILLTKNEELAVPKETIKCNSFANVFAKLTEYPIERCFVIGGANVYAQCINHSACDMLYITEILSTFDCDVFFPEFGHNYVLVESSSIMEEKGIKYCFKTYRRVR